MADTQLDLQSELFEDFKEHHQRNQTRSKESSNSVFNLALLKKTKVTIPFDTLLIIALMFIFVIMTFYFLGVQRGKNIQGQTIVTIEKNPGSTKRITVVSQQRKLLQLPQVVEPKAKVKPELSTAKINLAPVNNLPTPVLPQVPTKKGVQPKPKKYTIQVGASRNREAARKDIVKLQQKGYDAFLSPYTSSNGKKWYKLCVGRFKKTTDAKSLIKTLKTKERKRDCFLTNL